MLRAIVTGASSGIGEAVARALSRRGYALALVARRTELLEPIARSLPESVALRCDVADAAAVREAVQRGEEALGGPFDLAIANAGISLPTHASRFDAAAAETIVRTNLLGTIYLFDAVIPSMIARHSGRFAGVASIAGLRGLPSASVYSATKAAMQAFLEASRVELAPFGVGVTIVNPGFVSTAMIARRRTPPPLVMSAGRAGEIIVRGLERGSRVVEFPRTISLAARLARLLPDALYDRATRSLARRRSDPAAELR
jgi:short-subunit dehydrogenase